MDRITEISLKIKEYSDLLGSIMLEDYKQHLDEDTSNLTAKQEVILELLKNAPKTIGEIAESFSMTASAASQIISKLEKEGYVGREINASNRREIIVSLSKKGKDYHEKRAKLEHYLIQKYFAKLDLPDLENLLVLYEKLYAIAVKVQEE
ncbi:MarR family winged helix-turn-helix transcriptional regulator [Peribacillus glennii]|uniref:MarR family transcriptional regulator n=1 Tax=Peribacillus glennii TaxID=2303991 RepID=A0A372L9X7_9BACI|nr:MarR family transcriptional regulator [Peribacillus glennii]RFU62408.1 MarR family transcriptional regulator [Peribacillus glennii]